MVYFVVASWRSKNHFLIAAFFLFPTSTTITVSKFPKSGGFLSKKQVQDIVTHWHRL